MPAKGQNSSDEEEERRKEETKISTRTPFYPWFHDHVQRSTKKSFTPLYYTLGLVEEMGKELVVRRNMMPNLLHNPRLMFDEVERKVGDICWYIYALCGALEGVMPETVDDDGFEPFDDDMMSVVSPLCGSMKKWSRGNQDWAVLRPQVQANVSRVLRHLAYSSMKSFMGEPLKMAMRANIVKMRGK